MFKFSNCLLLHTFSNCTLVIKYFGLSKTVNILCYKNLLVITTLTRRSFFKFFVCFCFATCKVIRFLIAPETSVLRRSILFLSLFAIPKILRNFLRFEHPRLFQISVTYSDVFNGFHVIVVQFYIKSFYIFFDVILRDSFGKNWSTTLNSPG